MALSIIGGYSGYFMGEKYDLYSKLVNEEFKQEIAARKADGYDSWLV